MKYLLPYLLFFILPFRNSAQKLIVQASHRGMFTNFQFSSDEKYLVSWQSSLDQPLIKTWETATNRMVKNFTGARYGISDVAISSTLDQLYCIDVSL